MAAGLEHTGELCSGCALWQIQLQAAGVCPGPWQEERWEWAVSQSLASSRGRNLPGLCLSLPIFKRREVL